MKIINNLLSNGNKNLNPSWVTGFTDAEGCFSVILSKRSNLKWRIMVSFEINLHIKDIDVLHLIKTYFGVGLITYRASRSTCVYRVTKIEDLINVIIPHFLNFPVYCDKLHAFNLLYKIVNALFNKEKRTIVPNG